MKTSKEGIKNNFLRRSSACFYKAIARMTSKVMVNPRNIE